MCWGRCRRRWAPRRCGRSSSRRPRALTPIHGPTRPPPATDPSELSLRTETGDGPIPLTLQAEPVRRLPNLSRFPIAVVTAEASTFRMFDRHLVAFLEQGGCHVELLRLADHGVHGNSHGIMLERNHADALAALTSWVAGIS